MTQHDVMRGQPKGAVLPVPSEAEARYDASGKSADMIESDINETRAQLGRTLEELERKLAPRYLLERGVDMLRDTMMGNSGQIGETLRNHPVPLALIGVGIGWLLMSGASRGQGRDYGHALRERVSGAVGDVAERAGVWAGQVKEKVTSAVSTSRYPTEAAGHAYGRSKPGDAEGTGAAWQGVGDYADYASDRLGMVRDRFAQVMEEHPLAVGVLGLAAGAVIAFMLPATQAEESVIGPVREQFRDQAASLGREAVERAQHVAERAVDAVKDTIGEAVDASAGKPEERKI